MNKAYLRLTPGQSQTASGLLIFRLGLWVDGKEADHTWAVSGQPGRQTLRKGRDRWPGSMEPIGEGVYDLGDSDAKNRVNWASGQEGNFAGSFGSALGPAWIGIHPRPGQGIRSYDFGIHADANQDWSPGTSGCVGIQEDTPGSLARLKRVVGWFSAYDVSKLEVDHGFGTVPKPKV